MCIRAPCQLYREFVLDGLPNAPRVRPADDIVSILAYRIAPRIITEIVEQRSYKLLQLLLRDTNKPLLSRIHVRFYRFSLI